MDQEVQDRIHFWDALARQHDWTKVRINTRANSLAKRQRYEKPLRLSSDGETELMGIDGWPTTKTIATYLQHPTQGRTQLFRRELSNDEVAEIFKNPRKHTGKGYHRKEKDPITEVIKKRGHDDMVVDEDGSGDADDDGYHRATRKRRRVACASGQQCRDFDCPFSHPPRCFYGVRCWFQPNCWFDHTHGLCRFGIHCEREDCWFSHRNPAFYY